MRRPRRRHRAADPPGGHGPATRMSLERKPSAKRQREIARATAAKIDAIELAMTSDIFDRRRLGQRQPARPGRGQRARRSGLPARPNHRPAGRGRHAGGGRGPSSAPAVEEAAILYANDQLDVAEADAARQPRRRAGRAERQPWWMLFDLYQVSGREHEFESIAIDYASHFETSPPAYKAGHRRWPPPAEALCRRHPDRHPVRRSSTPSPRAWRGCWRPRPARWCAWNSGGLGATPEGCAAADALQSLRAGGRELVLAGAAELVAVLRPMLAIGDRGASEAPWLLLLELLLLLNREKDFEETAMDYCVTFEVSPPSFEAPAHAAVSVGAQRPTATAATASCCRPSSAATTRRCRRHRLCGHHPALVLDCSRLARIDYAGANALAASLRTAGPGRAQKGRAARPEPPGRPPCCACSAIGTQGAPVPHKY
jgi:hypothetical protein